MLRVAEMYSAQQDHTVQLPPKKFLAVKGIILTPELTGHVYLITTCNWLQHIVPKETLDDIKCLLILSGA